MLVPGKGPYKLPKRKIIWSRWIFTCAALITVAILLVVSYVQYHRQVTTACRLTVSQGYDIPPPFEATCIQQLGGYDDRP